MKLAPSRTWPLRNPPSLSDCRSEKGEAVFQKAMEHWLEKALLEYLPEEIICLVPAPLLPDSSGLSLPVPYLGRVGSESSYKGIARFGVVTALFQKEKASLFRRIHKYYGGVEPVIVKIRKDDGSSGIDPGVDEVGKFCLVSVPCSPDDQPHPGDPLTGGFISGKGKIFAVEPGRFQPDQAALREEEVPEPARDKGDAEIGRIVDKHIRNHSFYVPTLAPILHHAQVVMVLARSIHDDRWEERRKFGAGGVTFLLAPDYKMTEDLAIRLCAVAQRVDGLLGSLHFATEDVARGRAAADALDILKHSVGNHLDEIEICIPEAGPRLTVLERMLQGAVGCARQQGISATDNQRPITWNQLGFNGQPFDKTLRDVFWGLHDSLEFSISGLDRGNLDSRVIVLVEELARNLAKGPEDKPGSISITCNPETGLGNVRVDGWASTESLQKIVTNLNNTEPRKDALVLRGTGAIIQVVNSLQKSRVPSDYVLGEEAIEKFRRQIPPDIVNHELGFNLWNQENFVKGRVCYRPFIMIFSKIQMII